MLSVKLRLKLTDSNYQQAVQETLSLKYMQKRLNVDISSSGDMTLSGEADMLEADLSSAGDLNAYELEGKRSRYFSIECRRCRH